MAKIGRGHRLLSSHPRSSPYPLPPRRKVAHSKAGKLERASKAIKKDWEDAICSVCMEFPHNAVLLLCSSHDKGCRPYMCGTSHRYSNCLDQFKKAYVKVEKHGIDADGWLNAKKPVETELLCPLCRGPVKGWTVVEPAREYLNAKKRSCMQDNCSFSGTYRQLRKHVKAKHPSAKPRQVDPVLEQKWRSLEREREREDILSTLRSTTPGAMVFGDYVIENDFNYDSDEELFPQDGNFGSRRRAGEEWFDFFYLLRSYGSSNRNSLSSMTRTQRGFRLLNGEDDIGRHSASLANEHLPVNSQESDYEEDEESDDNESLVVWPERSFGERTSRRRLRRS